MGLNVIDDCDVRGCPNDPAWLDTLVGEGTCPVCERCIYNCSPNCAKLDWRRIHARKMDPTASQINVDDIVCIVEGKYEPFEAIVFKVNRDDQAAKISLRIFGRHVPFWISLSSLRLVEPAGSSQ